jgi:hypothetical protein
MFLSLKFALLVRVANAATHDQQLPLAGGGIQPFSRFFQAFSIPVDTNKLCDLSRPFRVPQIA